MSEHMLPELPPRPILPLPGLPPVGSQLDMKADSTSEEPRPAPQLALPAPKAPSGGLPSLPVPSGLLGLNTTHAGQVGVEALQTPHTPTSERESTPYPQLPSPAPVTSLQIPAVSSPLKPDDVAVGEHGSGQVTGSNLPEAKRYNFPEAPLYDVPGVDTPLPLDAAPAVDRSGPKGSLPGPYATSVQLPAPSQVMSGEGPRAPLTEGRFPTSPSSPTAMSGRPSVPSSSPPEAPRLPAVGGIAPEGLDQVAEIRRKFWEGRDPSSYAGPGVPLRSNQPLSGEVNRSADRAAPSLPSPTAAGAHSSEWRAGGGLSLPRPSSPALSPVAAGVEELETPGVQRQEGGVMGELTGQFSKLMAGLDRLFGLLSKPQARAREAEPVQHPAFRRRFGGGG